MPDLGLVSCLRRAWGLQAGRENAQLVQLLMMAALTLQPARPSNAVPHFTPVFGGYPSLSDRACCSLRQQPSQDVGGPGLIGPSTSSALVVTELFCPSSLQVMRPFSVSPAVVNMHGFNPRMDLNSKQIPRTFNSVKRHPRTGPRGGVGGPGLIGPSTSSALVVTELFCPSSLHRISGGLGDDKHYHPRLLFQPFCHRSVGGPAVDRPFYQQALVVIELFCPSSLQIMRPLNCQETSQECALEVP
ncbi:uncharacterized protein BDCG_04697 [Blastomyces dermatitidis ER-3]|uniref:Uncharacterized protein n=1 Tax=Ajellomyces dermatitidis (strain ER-3 / ATCC MYA-2586) TaxID=559297 RepID=A0ABP2F3E7_AJEDR|nr:uncharacterized protein BDCG_04697 [Blastomyces dermatitidis ER-3]EEQ89577.1 hypothetical protein BDCG_04697 [Blastomyces dermatitidis ER-3]